MHTQSIVHLVKSNDYLYSSIWTIFLDLVLKGVHYFHCSSLFIITWKVRGKLKLICKLGFDLIYEQLLLFPFWKEQVAYSFLFWLTIKIWIYVIASFLIRLIFLNWNLVSISPRVLMYTCYFPEVPPAILKRFPLLSSMPLLWCWQQQ